jgi:hypothetical protein
MFDNSFFKLYCIICTVIITFLIIYSIINSCYNFIKRMNSYSSNSKIITIQPINNNSSSSGNNYEDNIGYLQLHNQLIFMDMCI